MPYGFSQIFLVFFALVLLGAQSSAIANPGETVFGETQGGFRMKEITKQILIQEDLW